MSFKKIFNFFFNQNNEKYGYDFCKVLPVEEYPKYLKKIYKIKTGKTLNLEKPKRFTEKIQWLKLYDNLPIKKTLTNKLTARELIEPKIGSEYFPKIYGIWDKFEEIPFDALPETFMLKANHGCKMNIGVSNKTIFLNNGLEPARELFKKWMVTNFTFACGFELQYDNIPRKIYAEEKLTGINNKRPIEYNIHCFNGKPTFIEQFFYDKKNTPIGYALYDFNWNIIPVAYARKMYKPIQSKPNFLQEMFQISEKLSKDFKFVRVDFLDTGLKLYFSEMTFTPYSGFMKFKPDKYDQILGDLINLDS